jgi:ABC-2 type transport system permease protein
MQMPVFLLLFLAPVYVPVTLLSGWIKGVAEVNPVTPLIEAGRELIAGGDPAVGLAAAVVAGLLLFFAVWAVRGLRRAEAAG